MLCVLETSFLLSSLAEWLDPCPQVNLDGCGSQFVFLLPMQMQNLNMIGLQSIDVLDMGCIVGRWRRAGDVCGPSSGTRLSHRRSKRRRMCCSSSEAGSDEFAFHSGLLTATK